MSADRTLWVLLPAFNEAENLVPLLRDVATTFADWPGGTPKHEVLVVDDGSADDSAAVARAGGATVLEHGTNKGLGLAMKTGIEHVIEHGADDDLLFAMDADHTHPPELMPGMLARLDQGADLVIASRFQKGAEVHGLTFLRKAISVMASGLLRVMFPGARDYTCGYRGYRVGLLRWGANHYGEDFLNQQGFSVMVDVLLKLRRQARRIDEVPLILRYDRKQGASKMKIVKTAVTTLKLLGRRFVGNPRGP